MNLHAYVDALGTHIAANPPDFGKKDSGLSLLYEARSESNAMYDDEIKADFHILYSRCDFQL
jgi:hypothetical protein